ncbi:MULTISPECIES: hypothetical protein [unclassified Pseudoalteromonas]|uniref:hypothetical protein n=1 Tax=unclassified Pseudoalteromonas TaxID=194690 RepID=UPI001109138C|nr:MULTISPECIES: hypothetical protein [unclassified Pseudoalteromonas]TMN82913.1 hypothetical protein CWB64_09550 [Pseudoalteromonas sp. S410]TMN90273.1 hypothetical protein CWB62_10455 [Pseudoalteromonas sp. S408]TMO00835.1 hypothetical protein CWB61_00615 [Pseudoalteromonas sp. S407]TMO01952.1 hypothetical protein CWB63_02560 [Pseudoalteromonas sp. S409]TMO12276.1 hypothetical protein CWB57_02945 [Pseudoalteromonas sp. S186]
MNNLSTREKVAFTLCISFAFLLLISGIYDFLIIEFKAEDLMMSIGAFLMLLSLSLMPKIFFSPFADIFKSTDQPTIGNAKVQQWLMFSSVLLCAFGFALRLFL